MIARSSGIFSVSSMEAFSTARDRHSTTVRIKNCHVLVSNLFGTTEFEINILIENSVHRIHLPFNPLLLFNSVEGECDRLCSSFVFFTDTLLNFQLRDPRRKYRFLGSCLWTLIKIATKLYLDVTLRRDYVLFESHLSKSEIKSAERNNEHRSLDVTRWMLIGRRKVSSRSVLCVKTIMINYTSQRCVYVCVLVACGPCYAGSTR